MYIFVHVYIPHLNRSYMKANILPCCRSFSNMQNRTCGKVGAGYITQMIYQSDKIWKHWNMYVFQHLIEIFLYLTLPIVFSRSYFEKSYQLFKDMLTPEKCQLCGRYFKIIFQWLPCNHHKQSFLPTYPRSA